VRAQHLRDGNVKNPYHPTVFGVGFMGVGIFKSRKHGSFTEEFLAWSGMMTRCYSDYCHKKQPTYAKCEAHPEWHDFQSFAQWYTHKSGYGLGFHLDKDLLCKGNKVYSRGTCSLVPRKINNLLISRDASRGGLPIGVYNYKPSGKYRACVRLEGKTRCLGIYGTPESAFHAYKLAKEAHIRELVENDYSDVLSDRLKTALLQYRVEITD